MTYHSTHLVFLVVAAAESARAGSAARLARDEDEGARVAGCGRPRAGWGTGGAGEGRLAVRRPDGVKLSLLGLQEDLENAHYGRFESNDQQILFRIL